MIHSLTDPLMQQREIPLSEWSRLNIENFNMMKLQWISSWGWVMKIVFFISLLLGLLLPFRTPIMFLDVLSTVVSVIALHAAMMYIVLASIWLYCRYVEDFYRPLSEYKLRKLNRIREKISIVETYCSKVEQRRVLYNCDWYSSKRLQKNEEQQAFSKKYLLGSQV